MDKEGNYDYLGKVLEKDYHLSYPFVFEFENNFYMVPETESNNNIELYKCTDFPRKWEYHGEIMNNVSAVDTTILIMIINGGCLLGLKKIWEVQILMNYFYFIQIIH